jgi:Mg2+-importing ATPase
VESLLTELLIALVVRTRRPFFRSCPGNILLISTAVIGAIALAIPYLPGVELLGFVPLPPAVLLSVIGITSLYVVTTELAKAALYRNIKD